MNDGRLRSAYVVGLMGSAYAFWYVVSSLNSYLYAIPFALMTVFFVVRLRRLITDS